MDASYVLDRLPAWFTLPLVLLVSASIGSFLNVVIWRLPRGESLISPGSRCPGCSVSIRWFDNVPIFSWMLLRGRCRRCGVSISARYLLVEVATMALGLACLVVFGPSLAALRAFTLCALLVALTYIDLDHWLLPHALTWSGIALGLATSIIPGGPGLLSASIGGAVGFVAFGVVRVVGGRVFGREALGFGDLFLLAMLGAYLGWRPLAPVVFLASMQGSIVGLILLLSRRLPAGSEDEPQGNLEEENEEENEEDLEEEEWVPPAGAMPFGPFLALAGFEMLFFGDTVIEWVASLMGL